MKKVYAALALIVLIIVIGISEKRAACRTADSVLELISAAESADSEQLFAGCTRAADEWLSSARSLQLFLPQGGLDEADLVAARLTEYAAARDEKESRVMLHELKNRMNSLKSSEQVDLYTLM